MNSLPTTPLLQLLKGFISNFDVSDKDLVNINIKSYLLPTLLSCFAILFSYGTKSFGVSEF